MNRQIQSGEGEPSGFLKVISYVAIAVAVVVIAFFINLIVSANKVFENDADPDNRRLEALDADPAVTLKPTGARLLTRTNIEGEVNSKSRVRTGPRIYLEYSTPNPGADYEEFYRRRLTKLGWKYKGASQSPGNPETTITFQKAIDDWNGTLILGKEDAEVWIELQAPPVQE